jgi:dienelactone hydrolase
VIASDARLRVWPRAITPKTWRTELDPRPILLAAILLGSSACAMAPLQPVVPGVPVELGEDEGLVVVQIDTEIPLEQLSLDRAVVSGAISSGRHIWLVRLATGRYRWKRVAFGSRAGVAQVYPFEPGDVDLRFDVEAGKINYPGELVIRAHPVLRSARGGIYIRNRNHSALAVRELRRIAPDLLSAYPLRHAGPRGDGFLDYYSRERDRSGKSARADEVPENRVGLGNGRSGHPAAVLFAEDGIQQVLISPRGEWVLAHAVRGRHHGLLVQGRGLDSVRTAFAAPNRILNMVWVGRDRYLAVFDAGDGGRRTLLGRIAVEDGEVEFEHAWIDAPGLLVDPLPLLDDTVIWEVDHRGKNTVHRVRLEELIDAHAEGLRKARSVELGETIASIRGSARVWITDRQGQPRAALRREEGVYSLLVRPAGEDAFREIYRFDEADDAAARYPVALTPDGTRLIVVAYDGGDTMGLFEADMEGAIQGVIFVREGVDVSDVLIDGIDGELIAAVYYEGGERRFHYLDSYAGRQLEPLREAFPKEEVHAVSANMDRSRLVFMVSGAKDPGTYYLLNSSTNQTTRIAETAAGIRDRGLADVETIEVRSKDGRRIEAFLAMPPELGSEGAPLVVYPHGGPIGVRDTKHYDELVQYLASWGFATLRVNYRGSSGYGRTFEEEGKRQWARGIEDDIDSAVEQVLSRPEIDASRVCIVGGSYGGFAAVASIVRHKHRYQCAATLNGVSDIPLVFEESDCAESERCIARWKEYIGDPETERDRLVEESPAYHVRDLETPVFVAYGSQDRRVDPDHSHRLILMLETFGKEHDALELEGAGHSPTRREWAIYARALRRFLTKYLLPGQGFVEDPLPGGDDPMLVSPSPVLTR